MKHKIILNITTILSLIMMCSAVRYAQEANYPPLSECKIVLQGDSGKWDYNKVHTLSVVKADKDGYKYWGYYGLSYYGGDPQLRKGGLVRSNDLIHWTKYDGNPIFLSDCRWPSAVLVNNIFYVFFAQYNQNNDSRIIMLTSKDGIHFGDTTVVVKREVGNQNQNPFVFFNKQDGYFYLTYYHGVERSNDKPLVGRQGINKKVKYIKKIKNFWQIRIIKSKTIDGLKNAKPKTLLNSSYTIASPSIAYFNNKYYLLIESIKEGKWDNKWVTLAYQSDKINGKYKELDNNPLLTDNDACAFQYVFNNQLYIFYSHCLNLANWDWELEMQKVIK